MLWINQSHSHMGSPDALLKIATLFSMTAAQQTDKRHKLITHSLKHVH